MKENAVKEVVEGFGDEWSRFDQSELSNDELLETFNGYFNNFPWHKIGSNSIGFDLGCGSGRWAKLVAPRVGTLHLIDPSDITASTIVRRGFGRFIKQVIYCVRASAVCRIPYATVSVKL